MRRHLGTISPKRRQRISSGKPRARRAQMTRALVQPLQWHSASYSHRFPKWKKEDGQLALMPLHMLRGQEPFRLIRPDRSGVWLLR